MPRVQISSDGMEARLVLGDDERLNEYQALIHVARGGVRHGLLHEAIAGVPELVGPAEVVVARAILPDDGKDATVEMPRGNTAFPFRPSYDGTGQASFPELPIPEIAQAGEVVAIKSPPVPPRPGRTVTGATIGPAPGAVKDVELRAGLGTELAYDRMRVVAVIDGNPSLVDGVVTVRPQLALPGDVGPDHGDVRFGGNVLVAGNLCGDIEVLAAGDITVLGDVEKAKLAAGGRVVVHGTVRRDTTIVASTDVIAKAIENASVRCGGTLTVREDLIVTTVEGARVIVVGASVEGGTLQASERVEARVIGGPGGTPTRLNMVMASAAASGGPAVMPHVLVRVAIHPGVEVRIARAIAKFTSPQPAGVLREDAGNVALAPMTFDGADARAFRGRV